MDSKVTTKRNDRWAVMHPHLMLQAHRANVNAQVILELRVHLDYVTKYATKIEERSDIASVVLQHLEDIADKEISTSIGIAKSFAICSAGNHDRSSHEVAHILQGLEFAVSNIPQSRFKNISLNNSPKINVYTKPTQNSFLDHYAHRNSENSQLHPEILEMSLNTLAPLYNYDAKENRWKKLNGDEKKVITYFPGYGSNPKNKTYPQFCKFALIRFRPWKCYIEDAWGCTQHSTIPSSKHLINMWEEFYRQGMSIEDKRAFDTSNPRYAKQLEMRKKQSSNSESSDEHIQYEEQERFPTFNALENQEPWMELTKPSAFFPINDKCLQQDHNWQESTRHFLDQYLGVQLDDLTGWIKKERRHMGPLKRKRRVIDTTKLVKEGQLKVYNLVKEHCTTFRRGTTTPLNMLVVGTAGTGKSFLIDALVGLLSEKRVMVTATTGICIFFDLWSYHSLSAQVAEKYIQGLLAA